eukprot:10177384-Alexandrium_andersonii.AAC.1
MPPDPADGSCRRRAEGVLRRPQAPPQAGGPGRGRPGDRPLPRGQGGRFGGGVEDPSRGPAAVG